MPSPYSISDPPPQIQHLSHREILLVLALLSAAFIRFYRRRFLNFEGPYLLPSFGISRGAQLHQIFTN